jgi:hypothetical protein
MPPFFMYKTVRCCNEEEAMYIHLGGDKIVRTSQLVGIFDVSIAQISKINQQFIEHAQKNRKVETIGEEEPKSIVLTDERVYYSPISSTTLKKRAHDLDS